MKLEVSLKYIDLCLKVPNKVYVACSGGPDSMAAVDFFRRGRKDVTIAHFDHGTEHGEDAQNLVLEWAKSEGIPVVSKKIRGHKPSGKSWEDWWRQQRYSFLHDLPGLVVTGHNLDDAVEWWIMSSLHGMGKTIPKTKQNVIRPFLTTPKKNLEAWCEKNHIPFVSDPSNCSDRFTRAIVRHRLMPEALKVNPGLFKTIRKKIHAI